MIRNIDLATLIALLMLSVDIGCSDMWYTNIATDNSSWSIYGESNTLNFEYSQSVDGKISPVDFRGRSLKPYHSNYVEVKANDVRTRERTAALEGSLSAEESIRLKSSTLPDRLCEGKECDYCTYCPVSDVPCCYTYQVSLSIWKHAGEDIYKFLIFEK